MRCLEIQFCRHVPSMVVLIFIRSLTYFGDLKCRLWLWRKHINTNNELSEHHYLWDTGCWLSYSALLYSKQPSEDNF